MSSFILPSLKKLTSDKILKWKASKFIIQPLYKNILMGVSLCKMPEFWMLVFKANNINLEGY